MVSMNLNKHACWRKDPIMIEITSESQYKEVEQSLISFCEHPLFGELPEHQQEYEDTLAILDKWRKDNPLNC